jgi:Rrf2 family protein
MIFSRTSKYAVRALANMAARKQSTPIDVKTVSKATGVPPAYVAKIFQGLAHADIVISRRGPGGGYFLKKDPRRISLYEVIDATDDMQNSPLSGCVMGLAECNHKNQCPLHAMWVKARESILAELRSTTINELINLKQNWRSKKNRRVLSKSIRAVFG